MVFEKQWYTISDLSVRWGLSVGDVLDLIINGHIKLFIDIRKIKLGDEFKIVWEGDGDLPLGDYMPIWQDIAIKLIRDEEAAWLSEGVVDCPFQWRPDRKFKVVHSSEGFQSEDPYKPGFTMNPSFSVTSDDIGMPHHYLKEVEANKAENDKSDFSYRTDLIDVLIASMERIFPDERASDPKKTAAVMDIIEIGKQRNTVVSNNIAEAIFTIIKPDDHNPKAKRVKV